MPSVVQRPNVILCAVSGAAGSRVIWLSNKDGPLLNFFVCFPPDAFHKALLVVILVLINRVQFVWSDP